MGNYKMGKDVGTLLARVNNLERNSCNCSCGRVTTGSGGLSHHVSDQDLFDSLNDASPDRETFDILKRLVTDAGHITIRDLFACTADDVAPAVVNAIKKAKTIGFMALSNDKCCNEVEDPFENDYCTTAKGKWCGLVRTQTKKRCTLASDDC